MLQLRPSHPFNGIKPFTKGIKAISNLLRYTTLWKHLVRKLTKYYPRYVPLHKSDTAFFIVFDRVPELKNNSCTLSALWNN